MSDKLREARERILAEWKYCGEPLVELPLDTVLVDRVDGKLPRLLIGMDNLIKIVDAAINGKE